ncbi:MAG: hypothetical protein ACHQHN_02215 [Sphingobacteriales bacterium]
MKAKLRKPHKIGIIITCAVIGVILILALLVNAYWSPILAKQVKKAVLKSSDSLYNINFSDADLHILKGEIDIYDLTLKPDTAVYNRRKKLHLAPNNLVELHVKRLILYHIHPFSLYFHHKLDIGQVMFDQPEIMVSYQLNHTKDTTSKDHRTVWQKMSKTLHSIHIGQISLGDIKFKYEDYSGHKLAISELKEMNVSATDLLIDSNTQTDKSRLLYCRNIEAELNNYAGRSANGLYKYQIKSLRLSTQTSRLNIDGLDLSPVKPEVFFDKTYHDRFKIHLDSVQLNHFDYLNYHKYRIVDAGSLIISNGDVEIFSNPRQSPVQTDRIKSFPHFALQQMTTNINIDTINAHHIDISYTEFNTKSKKTGTITFKNSDGHIINVTTNKDSLQKNNICTAGISSYFMNRGKLDVLFKFNLTDKNASYTYKGKLGAMDLPVINQATMPLALLKFNTGKLKQMDFDISANRKTSNGKVTVLYNGLKLTVLKADTANDRLKHMTIASLFANLLVIKHDNPDKDDEKPRSANVRNPRADTVSFFSSIWQTLLAGIKPCAGLDEKKQSSIKAAIAGMKVKKVDRLAKKAIRKQRRAERRAKRELKKEQKAAEKQAGGN